MVVLDTNVLLNAANHNSQFHVACDTLVESLRRQSGTWYTTWPICNEFLRVMTHPAVIASPWSLAEAWNYLEALYDSRGFGILTPTENHRMVAAQVFAEMPHLWGGIFHDTHTAILMREHGIRQIYTLDTDFHKFKFLQVLDPTSPSQ